MSEQIQKVKATNGVWTSVLLVLVGLMLCMELAENSKLLEQIVKNTGYEIKNK